MNSYRGVSRSWIRWIGLEVKGHMTLLPDRPSQLFFPTGLSSFIRVHYWRLLIFAPIGPENLQWKESIVRGNPTKAGYVNQFNSNTKPSVELSAH